MKPRIKHVKVKRVRTSITIPEPMFAASAGNASKHESFSAYVQALIQRDVEHGTLQPQEAGR